MLVRPCPLCVRLGSRSGSSAAAYRYSSEERSSPSYPAHRNRPAPLSSPPRKSFTDPTTSSSRQPFPRRNHDPPPLSYGSRAIPWDSPSNRRPHKPFPDRPPSSHASLPATKDRRKRKKDVDLIKEDLQLNEVLASRQNTDTLEDEKRRRFKEYQKPGQTFVSTKKLAEDARLKAKEAALLAEKKARQRAVKKQRVNVKLEVPSIIRVADLARLCGKKLEHIKRLMAGLGMDDNRPDRVLQSEDATFIALEFGFDPVVDDEAGFDIFPSPTAEDATKLLPRPPITCVMGHVDHGKTSLLDSLRSTSVARGEAGGITQHIGAFSVPLSALSKDESRQGSITFLDTPGHEAFKAMRSRGAGITDVVVLVVAADDGVKPQTEEVIRLIKSAEDEEAKVGVVVAITKCDKPATRISEVKNQLFAAGIEVEDLGGDVPCVECSAHSRVGLDELVETIAAVAEFRECKAEREGVRAQGRIIESRVEKGRGNVATMIVQRGTLNIGDTLLCGTTHSKIRSLTLSTGATVSSVLPGTPVETTGWKDLPSAGDEVLSLLPSEGSKELKRVIDNRLRRNETRKMEKDVEVINEKRRLEALAASQDPAETPIEAPVEDTMKELRIIIKADFSGTTEAVTEALQSIGNEECKVTVVHSGVGDLTDSDLTLADSAKATIVGFNVKIPKSIAAQATGKSIPIISGSIIYRLIESIKTSLVALLPKLTKTRITGEGSVLQVFNIAGKNKTFKVVAGVRISNGLITRKDKIRVVRENEEGEKVVVKEGTLDSLKQGKKDAEEIRKGSECGLSVDGWDQVRVGDEILAYEEIEIPRTL